MTFWRLALTILPCLLVAIFATRCYRVASSGSQKLVCFVRSHGYDFLCRGLEELPVKASKSSRRRVDASKVEFERGCVPARRGRLPPKARATQNVPDPSKYSGLVHPGTSSKNRAPPHTLRTFLIYSIFFRILNFTRN